MDTHCDSHISRSKSISYSTGPKHVGGGGGYQKQLGVF